MTRHIKKKAFVLMPFRQPYESYYPAVFKPALEAAGYEVTRVDDLSAPLPIIFDIQRSILGADLVLCEMSEKNPNVFYELGLAHAIGRPAILVSRKVDDIPFDLRHIRTIVYDYTVAGWEDKLRQSITVAAHAVDGDEDTWPPPLARTTVKRDEDQPIEYDAVISDLFALADAFGRYSMEPPRGSYEEWEAAEGKVKEWISRNQLRADATVLDLVEKVAIRIRNFVVEGQSVVELVGGTGRPTERRLQEMTTELRNDIRHIVNHIRQVGG